MAFATTLIRRGTAGDLKLTAGKWTGVVGDASGTIDVEGTQVYDARFLTNTSTSPTQIVPVSWSTSGQVTTITVHNRQTVTDGRFLIVSA